MKGYGSQYSLIKKGVKILKRIKGNGESRNFKSLLRVKKKGHTSGKIEPAVSYEVYKLRLGPKEICIV